MANKIHLIWNNILGNQFQPLEKTYSILWLKIMAKVFILLAFCFRSKHYFALVKRIWKWDNTFEHSDGPSCLSKSETLLDMLAESKNYKITKWNVIEHYCTKTETKFLLENFDVICKSDGLWMRLRTQTPTWAVPIYVK